MNRPFHIDEDRSFSQLSLRDLLDARDQYHVHLMRHENVVATAIGYYRIRKEDSWPNVPVGKRTRGTSERTLTNSEVRPYSWPCVLVFVERWVAPDKFTEKSEGRKEGKFKVEDMVPPTLYLPDGRKVLVCVIVAPRDPVQATRPLDIRYPVNNIGGGWPVLASVQGQEHVATIACLVRDGHKVYALTNRHVAGEAGEVLYSMRDGRRERIGVADERQLSRVPFADLYAGMPARNTFVNMDVGLIEVDDLDQWTAEVKGVGILGPMVDMGVDNMSLHLIGADVVGQGAASGLAEGEVHALFYRYQSKGGFDYVADLLIGPRTDGGDKAAAAFTVRPGDSGRLFSVMHKDPDTGAVTFHPLALQWGAQYLGDGSATQGYALATCLSTVCHLLELDIVQDWNSGTPNTWGAVGHFSITTSMVNAIGAGSPKLRKLLEKHEPIISHPAQTILDIDNKFEGMGNDAFVPMADVPDFFWKHGKQGSERSFEGSNHYADMDHPRDSDGMTLFKLCKIKKSNLDPSVWNTFMDDLRASDGNKIARNKRGLLPFRVWQIVDDLIGFAAKKFDHGKFICAAGVLAHYLGDACQPLHMSYLHDGDPDNLVAGPRGGQPKPFGSGVHSAYESAMLNAHRQELIDALKTPGKVKATERVATGEEAAHAVLALMKETYTAIAPKKLITTYVDGKRDGDANGALWNKFGAKTLKQMKRATHLLAVLVESAWVQGGGEGVASTSLTVTKAKAMAICANDDFLPSRKLEQMVGVLTVTVTP